MITQPYLQLAALVALLGTAVYTDLRVQRIPNFLIASSLAIAVSIQLALRGIPGVQTCLLGAGTGLLCFAPLYLLRGMGAGDVKLLAAIGAFTGPRGAVAAAVISLCVGGIGALAYVAWQAACASLRSYLRNGWANASTAALISMRVARRQRFAFAVPIAAGGLAAAGLSGFFQGLL